MGWALEWIWCPSSSMTSSSKIQGHGSEFIVVPEWPMQCASQWFKRKGSKDYFAQYPVTLSCFFLGLYSPLVIAARLKISLLIYCFSFYCHKTVVHAPNVLNEDFNDEEIKLFDSKRVSGYLFVAILCFRILNVYLCWNLKVNHKD